MAPENGDDADSSRPDILAELAEAEAAEAQAIADAADLIRAKNV